MFFNNTCRTSWNVTPLFNSHILLEYDTGVVHLVNILCIETQKIDTIKIHIHIKYFKKKRKKSDTNKHLVQGEKSHNKKHYFVQQIK